MPDWNRPQPAPIALWNLIARYFPLARNSGIFNQRNIAGTHTPSLHSEGRALDIGLDANKPDEKALGDALFKIFMSVGTQVGLQEAIWNRRIWSASKPFDHPYTGHSPHLDHVHVGFTRAVSQQTAVAAPLANRLSQLRLRLQPAPARPK